MSCVVTMSLLFGTIPAQAQTVEMDGNTVTGIRGLDLNGVTYNVEFVRNTTAGLYSDPPIFDFSNATDAQAAVQAVNDVLNAQGNAFKVGPSEDDGSTLYRIGYDTIVKHFGGKDFGFDVTFTLLWSGMAPDLSSPGVWFKDLEPDDWPFVTDAIWADFTLDNGEPPNDDEIDLTGDVENADGTPLCALALASGQFEFTCNPNGPYSLLNLPTEEDGTVKRQVYVDGFFPNVERLNVDTDETVVMQRAGNCPDYNSFPQPGVDTGSAGKRINISGTVLQQNSADPVCAMALANGEFGFTCDGTGDYSANIPLDGNGQYKLQVYAEGYAPMVQAFDENNPNNDVRLARASECQ